MASAPFSVRIDDELREQVDILCELSDRSKAFITSKALEEYIARHKWRIEALQRAKQEADAGEFISHDAMLAWVDGLGSDAESPDPSVDVFKSPI